MDQRNFPDAIVAIGLSRGWLEALESFFRSLHGDPGMAFIVVPHENFQDTLQLALAGVTPMPVTIAAENEPIRPAHIYVGPADRILTVKNRRFRLAQPRGKRGLFPIDQTMISLAADCSEWAIGVLLPDEDGDGIRGLRAIREHGGLALAPESPVQGKTRMPSIPLGIADLTLPLEKMGPRLAEFASGRSDQSVSQPRAAPGARKQIVSGAEGQARIALVRAIGEPETKQGLSKAEGGGAEGKLAEMRGQLQRMVEEYETAVGELRSSNRELQSMNEELQSANKLIEASRRELQAVNEALDTVNAELQRRIEELDRANADLRNIFESTRLAVIFLDANLAVRTFTPAATSIIKLIEGDRGRPLADVDSNLGDTGGLRRDIQTVLQRGEPIERQVHHRDGTQYTARILPYQNGRGLVDGVLVLFMGGRRQKALPGRIDSGIADRNPLDKDK